MGRAPLAILLYFRLTEMQTMHAGPIEYYDRIPLKHDLEQRGIRVVPGGIARYGAHIGPGVVMMPGFVNIGAYVATGALVDPWATVGSGSGAQIGRSVHLAGGVGIGGVLEPVALSAITHIIDVTGDEPVTYKGRVPAGSIVIPGTRSRAFAAGEFQVACALIIGRRNQRTEQQLRPMDAARAFGFSL